MAAMAPPGGGARHPASASPRGDPQDRPRTPAAPAPLGRRSPAAPQHVVPPASGLGAHRLLHRRGRVGRRGDARQGRHRRHRRLVHGEPMTAVVKSKHELALGDALRLPRAIIGARTSILGQPGTGKTSTAVVLVEEAAAIGARFVVIDPTGAWYGLASSADGDGPGVDCAGNRVALTDSGRANAAWPTHAGTSREIQEAVMATLTPARQ